jgi:hypothetical protein
VDATGNKSKEKRNTRWMHYANNSRQSFIAAKDQYFFSQKRRRAALHFIKEENGIRTRNNTTTSHTQTHTNIPDNDHKPHYHGPKPTPPIGDHNDQQLHDSPTTTSDQTHYTTLNIQRGVGGQPRPQGLQDHRP